MCAEQLEQHEPCFSSKPVGDKSFEKNLKNQCRCNKTAKQDSMAKEALSCASPDFVGVPCAD